MLEWAVANIVVVFVFAFIGVVTCLAFLFIALGISIQDRITAKLVKQGKLKKVGDENYAKVGS